MNANYCKLGKLVLIASEENECCQCGGFPHIKWYCVHIKWYFCNAKREKSITNVVFFIHTIGKKSPRARKIVFPSHCQRESASVVKLVQGGASINLGKLVSLPVRSMNVANVAV